MIPSTSSTRPDQADHVIPLPRTRPLLALVLLFAPLACAQDEGFMKFETIPTFDTMSPDRVLFR